MHGNSGCRVDAYDAVRVLLPLNITVFTLDLSGSGLSEGQFITLGVRESEDLRSVIAHLRSGGKVTKIGLWGRSMGAATSLFYGAKDPSIAALVLDSPFSKLTDLMLELVDTIGGDRGMRVPRPLVRGAVALMRFSILRRAHFDISQLDVLRAASGSFVPALFGHATGDTFIAPRHSEALYAVYPGDKNLIRFEGGHNSQRPSFFYDSVSIFFLNTLHPPELSSAATARPAQAPRAPFVPAEMPPAPVVPVGAAPSAELDTLLRMGFPRQPSERALRRFQSVELAATWLVDNAGDGWAGVLNDPTLALRGAAHAEAAMASPSVPARQGGEGGFGDTDQGWEPPSGAVTLDDRADSALGRSLARSMAAATHGQASPSHPSKQER